MQMRFPRSQAGPYHVDQRCPRHLDTAGIKAGASNTSGIGSTVAPLGPCPAEPVPAVRTGTISSPWTNRGAQCANSRSKVSTAEEVDQAGISSLRGCFSRRWASRRRPSQAAHCRSASISPRLAVRLFTVLSTASSTRFSTGAVHRCSVSAVHARHDLMSRPLPCSRAPERDSLHQESNPP